MNCRELTERVTDYLEGALSPAERNRLETHLAGCAGCQGYFDQMRQMVGALRRLADEPVPAAAREKLLQAFRQHPPTPKRNIPLGIADERVAAGDHLAYFWESDEDFEQAVSFLEVGLRGNDFCVVFGHDQANQKVLSLLRRKGFEPERLADAHRLSVLGGGPTGEAMLGSIAGVFEKALASGAPLIRLLGNIGWGRSGWPEDDDILAFEARVTEAARQFPCVIVCLYDVRSLPGRIILRGGFETHPLTVRQHTLRENPFYLPLEPFLVQLRGGAGSRRIQ